VGLRQTIGTGSGGLVSLLSQQVEHLLPQVARRGLSLLHEFQ
jgi:hypothetical protein